MDLEIRVLENGRLPERAHPTDAGIDLYARSLNVTDTYIEYNTGVEVAIPEGFVGLLFPRSSSSKFPLPFGMANSVGVIDSGYRGEIKARFRYKQYAHNSSYVVGDKVCQLVIVPCMLWNVKPVEELPQTERGTGGFGSSGN